MNDLTIQSFCLGDWQTNCFVVHQASSPNCWIVDAGFEPDPLIAYIQDNKLNPTHVIQTHAHVDHIAGLGQIRETWPDIPILIHEAEKDFLTDPMLNLSIALADPIVAPQATETLTHGQVLHLNDIAFEVRHTPGHSPGGISLIQHQAKQAIVGDALFAGSIGRTDFPTSNHEQLMQSIETQLMTLPDDMTIYPGHGPISLISRERATNPFL